MTIQEAIKTIIQQNNKLTELINNVINNIGNEYDDTEIKELINVNKNNIYDIKNNYIKQFFGNVHGYVLSTQALYYIVSLMNEGFNDSSLNKLHTALRNLGDNYKSLYQIALTLKTFIESTDTADTTINTWREIENFLAGIEDSDSLLSIINNLSQEITNLQNNVTAELSQINTTLDAPITRDKIDKDNTGLFKSYNVSEIDDIKETGNYIIQDNSDFGKPSILLVFKKHTYVEQTLIKIDKTSKYNGEFCIKTREYKEVNNSWSAFEYSNISTNNIRNRSINREMLTDDVITIRYNIIINISDTAITSIKVNNTTKTVAELKTIISNINLNTDAIKITVKIGNINIPVKTFDLSGYIIAESIDFNTLNRSIYLVDIVNNTVTKKEINYLS